jgi:hypothetical protein
MKPARSDPPDRAALHGLLRLDPRIVFECAVAAQNSIWCQILGCGK